MKTKLIVAMMMGAGVALADDIEGFKLHAEPASSVTSAAITTMEARVISQDVSAMIPTLEARAFSIEEGPFSGLWFNTTILPFMLIIR